MKIRLDNAFHNTFSEILFHTNNPTFIRLSGRQLRRARQELCEIDGCDCLSDIVISLDGQTCKVKILDFDAEDDNIGLEIEYSR